MPDRPDRIAPSKRGAALIAAGLIAGPAAASGQQPANPAPERITIPRSDSPVTVAGRLDEAVWQTAAGLSLVRNDGPGAGREATDVRLFYDRSALYVGWIVSDSDIQGTFTERDSRYWEEEVDELFITSGDLTRYIELQWNPLGAVFDAIIMNTLGYSGISEGIEDDWTYTAAGMTNAVTLLGTVEGASDRRIRHPGVRATVTDPVSMTRHSGEST